MADHLSFGDSPWDDQVTLSHHNSSSSSLDKQDGQPEKSRPVADPLVGNSKREQEEEDDQVLSPVQSSTTPVKSPVRSRIKTSYKPRSRKLTEVKVEEADAEVNPLGPLGESNKASDKDAVDDSIDANVTHLSLEAKNAESVSLDDVPLSVPRENSSEDVAERLESLSLGHSLNQPSGPLSPPAAMFEISVEDPIKIGDLTSAHTVYTVHTKTSSPLFSKSEMSVTRRYRDFRWLYHALEHNNHGIIIPPPPEKQAVGRFNEDFVEQRRAALQTMMNKIATHTRLSSDPDLKIFLESDNFANDIKSRVVTLDELDQASGSGFMTTLGDAFSFSSKFVESSQWFIDKKLYVDALESQLKSLYKALELVLGQRKELSDATGEFATVLESLGEVEFSKQLTELLVSFSQAQTRIRDLYSRQCMQDILSLSTTLDEYIRLISSIRSVFGQRQKVYFAAQNAEHDLTKKRAQLDKLLRQGKTQQDKLSILRQDVEEQEKKVANSREAFDDISRVIMQEFERFEHEEISDFRNSVELFLENAVEAQKEAIEVWETFYQRGFAKVGA